jgi:hypothetical protein
MKKRMDEEVARVNTSRSWLQCLRASYLLCGKQTGLVKKLAERWDFRTLEDFRRRLD